MFNIQIRVVVKVHESYNADAQTCL